MLTSEDPLMARVRLDRHGRVRGYSLPLWIVVVGWALLIGALVSPIYGLASLFGAQNSTPVAIIELAWLGVCWRVWERVKARSARERRRARR